MKWYENRDRACYDVDTEIWFPDPSDRAAVNYATSLCATCPVREACLEDTMQFEAGLGKISRLGIYGGLTPAERHNLENKGRKSTRAEVCQNPECGKPIESRGTRRKYCDSKCQSRASTRRLRQRAA